MESASSHPARWVLISALALAAAAGVGIVSYFGKRHAPLASPPGKVRPWAEADFLRLTKPARSPGKSTDPPYAASNGGALPTTDPNWKVMVLIKPAAAEFVPAYEVIEWDAADGFTAGSGGGKIRWLAAKAFDPPLDRDREPGTSILAPFHADGSPLGEDEAKAMGITKRDREAWGLDLDHECGTAMRFLLELTGFTNLQWKMQGVFDATTHVSVLHQSSVREVGSELRFGVSLAVLHDTPLLAVIDLAHGETRDFQIPVAKGASVSHEDFHFEVIDVFAGTVGQGRTDMSGPGGVIELQYGVYRLPGAGDSFSVIYQINPPVMVTAVSVDAIDAAGKEIKNLGRFMDHAPVSKFDASLASAAALRVRYRPHLTRLLMKMKSLPGVSAPNLKPADLFDVKAPAITCGGGDQMRRFIAAGAQLKDVTGSFSYETPAAFPMVLTNASPREVAARYLALDSGRTLKVDPAALTIEFEPRKKPSWLAAAWERLKSLLWRP